MTATGEGDKKELIRRAAARVIASQGFGRSTIDMIATEAGVAVGTVYNYFHGKDDLLRHIFAVEHGKRAAFFSELEKRDLTAMERLAQGLGMHLCAVAEDDSAARIVLQEGLLPHPCVGEARGRGRVLAVFVRSVLAAGAAAGELRPANPDTVAALITGAVQGLLEAYLLGVPDPGGRRVALDDGLSELLALLRIGLEAAK
ncbi:MAG: TetR/AcrR family transcriptional regulator [Bacillota bacterium]|nr:TetR/AcrR family transcriptional regulator [Bacillota bacterium]